MIHLAAQTGKTFREMQAPTRERMAEFLKEVEPLGWLEESDPNPDKFVSLESYDGYHWRLPLGQPFWVYEDDLLVNNFIGFTINDHEDALAAADFFREMERGHRVTVNVGPEQEPGVIMGHDDGDMVFVPKGGLFIMDRYGFFTSLPSLEAASRRGFVRLDSQEES